MELLFSSIEKRCPPNFLHELHSAASEGHPVIRPMMAEWNRTKDPHCKADIHGTRALEFFRVRQKSSVGGTEFQLVQERMSRSMRQAGFGKDFALALSKVFFEMADNVGQHSEAIGTAPELTGLAGYHIAEGYVALCVADIGIGALGSLTSSKKWQHLKTASEALRAIIVDHASRREGQGEGDGFKQVLRALADRNTSVRLRSDDAAVLLEPQDSQRTAGFISSPSLRGVQMSLACDLRAKPGEKEISFPS